MSGKRGASHQITKDDYNPDAGADSDEDSATKELRLKQGFKRAPDEVIKKRLASTTPTAAPTASATSSNPFASTVLAASSSTSTEKPANPFAATVLAASSSPTDTAATAAPSTKKVFGFGSATGFGAVATTSASSSIGKGSSVGFGGGFASVGSTAGKSSGFGAAAALSSSATGGTTSGFGFGSSSSASPTAGATSKSLFGSVGASSITFSLSKKTDNGKDSAASSKEAVAAALPDKVDLKTGEEGEEEIHSGRCKSFEWVLGTDDDSADDTNDHGETKNKTNLSVQSSTQFQAAISTTKSKAAGNDDDNDQSDAAKGDKSSPSEDAAMNQEKNGEGTSAAAASTKPSSEEAASMQFRWMELGIGPVKILRSKSNPERLRLVQRRESSKMGPATKVILNVPLWRESTCERDRQALQYLRLKTMKEGKMCQYSLKFKESSDAGFFHHHLMDHIPQARKCFDETCTAGN